MTCRSPLSFFVLLLIINFAATPALAHESRYPALVLVTAGAQPVKRLSPTQFRKLFLNLPVVSGKQQLVPLIYTSDRFLYEIFLQKVIYMSERNYERMLVSKTFRTGRPRPGKFSSREKLVKALLSTPGSISFMWRDTAEKEKQLRIIQTLWEEKH
ncbi:hypothetical protein MNBD_GAMMA09-1403 [hydrothermal vent metagenome]|uniref:Uncharacterized protein n=1 Tax=hydrothermal vent metagenome TaxID=652676 RepID=A0A3B0X7Z3_9ZZZZ